MFHSDTGISVNTTPPLDISFYDSKKYNITRLQKLRIFSEYFNNHIEFSKLNINIKNYVISRIERTCFNLTIKKARNRTIPNSWDYEEFEVLYHVVCGKPLGYIDSSIDFDTANRIINIIIGDPDKAKWLASINHREIYPEQYEELERRQNADDQVTLLA